MPKRPTKQPQKQSWAVYHIKGTPAKFVGIVDDAPDERPPSSARSRNIRCPKTIAAG
jgi:hypothetical protein